MNEISKEYHNYKILVRLGILFSTVIPIIVMLIMHPFYRWYVIGLTVIFLYSFGGLMSLESYIIIRKIRHQILDKEFLKSHNLSYKRDFD